MSKIKLDKKDHQILYQLDLDSRQSDSDIGRKTRLSREVVNYRIRNLIRNGVIERFYTIIDTAKFGQNLYKIYLQFQNINKSREEEIIDFFAKLPNYGWLSLTAGKWDMIAGLWCKDIYEYNKLYSDFSNKFSKFVMNKAFTILLKALHYRKEYLINKKIATEHEVAIGLKSEGIELDATDTEILKILANNARMPITEIAKKIKITSRIIGYRVKELQRKKIILAFRVALNLNKMNLMFFKAILYLQNTDEQRIKHLQAYFAAYPNLGWVIYNYGPWEIEIEFEIESFEKFEESMKDLREKFGDIIRGTETVIMSKEFGGSQYFPGCYGKIDKIYSS